MLLTYWLLLTSYLLTIKTYLYCHNVHLLNFNLYKLLLSLIVYYVSYILTRVNDVNVKYISPVKKSWTGKPLTSGDNECISLCTTEIYVVYLQLVTSNLYTTILWNIAICIFSAENHRFLPKLLYIFKQRCNLTWTTVKNIIHFMFVPYLYDIHI